MHNGILQLFASDIIQKTGEADLNGDNKLDKISLSVKIESGEFILKINNASINGSFYNIEFSDNLDKEIGFNIVDIDKRDKYKEIEIFYNGYRYDLREFHIFTFDGNLIKIMLGPVCTCPAYSGYGIVLIDEWKDFWTKREKYVLNRKTRNLELVPQGLYYMGVEARVREMFPIYRTRTGSDIVAKMRPSSKCLILVYDPEGWYLMKSVSGLVGWTKDLSKLQLPLAG